MAIPAANSTINEQPVCTLFSLPTYCYIRSLIPYGNCNANVILFSQSKAPAMEPTSIRGGGDGGGICCGM